MNMPLCELIARFVANPKELAQAICTKREEIFAHIEVCDACADRMDAVSDPEVILDILAAEGSRLTPHESRQIDELVKADAAREGEIQKAVEDALLPFLGHHAASIGREFDPLALYGATEAVSLLIRSHITLDHTNAQLIELHTDGAVSVDRKSAIAASGVALEIARFTGLWSAPGLSRAPVERAPSDKAHALASWVFDAARDQRYLLRHFSVDPLLMRADALTLVPLAAGERIDDPLERWRPEQAEDLETLVFGLYGGSSTVCLFGIPAGSLGAPLDPDEAGVAAPSMQRPVCSFLASRRFVEALRTAEPSMRKFLLPDGAKREAELVGVFEEVAFEGREIQVAGAGRTLRGVVARSVFPAGVMQW